MGRQAAPELPRRQWIWGGLLPVGLVGLAVLACASPRQDDTDLWDVLPVDNGAQAADAGCNPPCGPEEICVGGRCVPAVCEPACPSGQECCRGVCTDTRTDPANCGACGATCAPQGNVCFAGSCLCNGAPACASGFGCCGELGCIDISSNPEHCGACGNVCEPGVECLSGTCGGSCLVGCPAVPNGRTACAGTRCAIASCDEGWADVDGVIGNGCECRIPTEPPGGDTCETAIDLGSVSDTASGETLSAVGVIIPGDDVDWYTFVATDLPDTDCDNFHVDVRFASNPSDQFAFDVYAGNCATSICTGHVRFSYYTDYRDTTGPEPRGECPCTTTNTADHNMCHDSGKRFYVRVRRASGTDGGTCESYNLTITNGVYSTS